MGTTPSCQLAGRRCAVVGIRRAAQRGRRPKMLEYVPTYLRTCNVHAQHRSSPGGRWNQEARAAHLSIKPHRPKDNKSQRHESQSKRASWRACELMLGHSWTYPARLAHATPQHRRNDSLHASLRTLALDLFYLLRGAPGEGDWRSDQTGMSAPEGELRCPCVRLEQPRQRNLRRPPLPPLRVPAGLYPSRRSFRMFLLCGGTRIACRGCTAWCLSCLLRCDLSAGPLAPGPSGVSRLRNCLVAAQR